MPQLTEKQRQRVDGILSHLDDFLDKRFAQAGRVNPKVTAVEGDIRWHQRATIELMLMSSKGFGPIKLVVGDILASADEEKKRALFNPVDQVSVLNEVIPNEDEAGGQRRAGMLEIRSVSSFYRALDPSLEKIVTLVQTWIWWDLRDASDLYRFEAQEARLKSLKNCNFDDAMQEHYRKEMGIRNAELTREQVLKFEMDRTAEIVVRFARARAAEPGHEIIVASEERSGSSESDAACVRLAKRLAAIEKIRAQQDNNMDVSVKEYYAKQMHRSAEQLTPETILRYETSLANRDREVLMDTMVRRTAVSKTSNYKAVKLESMKKRFQALQKVIGIKINLDKAENLNQEAVQSEG